MCYTHKHIDYKEPIDLQYLTALSRDDVGLACFQRISPFILSVIEKFLFAPISVQSMNHTYVVIPRYNN